jgi:hypothetical protein
MTPPIVTIVNEIAASLGHAGALSDEQLANVPSHAATIGPLLAWLDAFNANADAATQAALDEGHGWSAPQSGWDVVEPLDDERLTADSITHTTQSGRLTVIAEQSPAGHPPPWSDWRLSFSFEAGPLSPRCTLHHEYACRDSDACIDETAGRPVLDVLWTREADRVTCTVEFLDAALIAEKPSRVELLTRLARAAGLLDQADERLRYAIATAEAHAVAIDSLRQQSVACLERVDVTRPVGEVIVPSGGLTFTPDDFAPATT